MNLADVTEICELIVQAGFKQVILGIETPSAESLEKCRKLQNRGPDLVETVKSLLNGYRELMKKLYEPHTYYQRIRIFLQGHRSSGLTLWLSWSEFQAFLKSIWLLGIWYHGHVAYWRFFWSPLLRRPRQFHNSIELAIIGHHFRRVAGGL